MLSRFRLVLLCALCTWSLGQRADHDGMDQAGLSDGLCHYGNSVECCWGWRRTDQSRCRPHCQQGCKHGECVGPDRCKCHSGYTGKTCNQDLNECGVKPRPCKHRCMNTLGSYKCYCLDGYTAHPDGSCRNARTCYHANCQYGCEVMKGAVRCTCPSPGLRLGPDRRTCVDVDECVSGGGVCPRRRKCVNTFGSFTCKCHLGFKLTYINGRYTCIDKDVRPFCSLNPSSPKCRCDAGSCSAVVTVDLEPQRPRSTRPPPATTAATATTTATPATPATTATARATTPPPAPPTTAQVTTTTTAAVPETTTTTATSTTTAVTPPAVTPPAVTPPAVTSPAVTPPAVTPPAVTSPAVTPPAVTPPAVTPPAATVSSTTPAATEPDPSAATSPTMSATTSPTASETTTTTVTTTTTAVTTPAATPAEEETTVTVSSAPPQTTTVNNRINKDVTHRQRGDVHIPRHPGHNQVWEFDIELGNTAEDVADDPDVGVLRCGFDGGVCDWMSDGDGDLQWETAASPAGGRYLSVPELKAGQRSVRGARLAVQIYPPWSHGELCFSFSHWLTGNHVGVMQLFVKKRGRDQKYSPALWSRTGGHGWRNTQVTLTARSLDKVLLKAERRKGQRGLIAVDDVTLRQGACR